MKAKRSIQWVQNEMSREEGALKKLLAELEVRASEKIQEEFSNEQKDIGIFRQQLPDAILQSHLPLYPASNSTTHPCNMSSKTDSILDEALACFGQRIASILIQPAGEKDINYIASLRNEVVGIQFLSVEEQYKS